MLLSRRAAIKGLLATTVGALTGAYGVAYERDQLAVTSALLPVSGLPPALDGLRIALLTDIHHSRTVPADDVARAVQLALNERPDLIVLGGDYVTFGDRAFVGPVAELLAPLRAPHGVFAILGNHDDDRDMPAALAERDIEVLKDARTRVEVRGEGLELAGLRFRTRRPADVARVLGKTSATVILLAHDPPAGSPRPRRSMCRRCSQAIRMGGKWCFPASARWPAADSRSWRAWARKRTPRFSSAGGSERFTFQSGLIARPKWRLSR